MRLRLFILIPILISRAFFAPAQNYSEWAKMLTKKAGLMHYAPVELDDQFSEKLFKGFLQELDPGRIYFTAIDSVALSSFYHDLDEQVKSGDGAFLEEATFLFQKSIQRADSISQKLLSSSLDFNQPDFFSPGGENNFRAKDEAGLKAKWQRRIKSRLLINLFTRAAGAEGYSPAQLNSILAKEADARDNLAKLYHRRYARKAEDAKKITGQAFLTAISLLYDPHTAWFSMGDKESFSSSLSTENLSFGFYLEENNSGDVSISKVVPGGPAWKSGILNAGDILLEISSQTAGREDVSLLDADEIYHLLDEAGTETVEFTVRKQDGRTQSVKLTKAKMRADENLVKSLVLSGENKFGYINLPGFYSDWDGETPTGCANDVAKELLKLQKENVQGVILDLRFNGGGSMYEAAELAGIFIDAGPLWISRDKNNVRSTLKDPNRGAIYNGPLILLVNGASASASEFLASVLQDHHRALIVGSTTFGKATSQTIISIDPTYRDPDAGFMKVTTHKYYRLGGNAHQLSGITPDIEIPDPWVRWMSREEDYDYVLPADTVVKRVYFEAHAIPGIDVVISNSENRVAANQQLADMEKLCDEIEQFLDNKTPFALDPAQVFQWLEKRRLFLDMLENASDATDRKNFDASSATYDKTVLALDEFSRELQNEWIKKVQKDLYIQECFEILDDMVHK